MTSFPVQTNNHHNAINGRIHLQNETYLRFWITGNENRIVIEDLTRGQVEQKRTGESTTSSSGPICGRIDLNTAATNRLFEVWEDIMHHYECDPMPYAEVDYISMLGLQPNADGEVSGVEVQNLWPPSTRSCIITQPHSYPLLSPGYQSKIWPDIPNTDQCGISCNRWIRVELDSNIRYPGCLSFIQEQFSEEPVLIPLGLDGATVNKPKNIEEFNQYKQSGINHVQTCASVTIGTGMRKLSMVIQTLRRFNELLFPENSQKKKNLWR